MIHFLTLRLLVADSESLLYCRNMSFGTLEYSLAPLLQQVASRMSIHPGDILHVAIRPRATTAAASTVMPASRGTPAGARWLTLFIEDPDPGEQAIVSLLLHAVPVSPAGTAGPAMAFELPLSFFDRWFDKARERLISAGVLLPDQAVRREVLLSSGITFREREQWPGVSALISGPEEEENRRDVTALKHRRMPPPRGEVRCDAIATISGLAVFVRRGVLAELQRAAAANTDREIGGILVGRAYQDADASRPFITVNAAISALSPNISSDERLQFSHEDTRHFSTVMQSTYPRRETLGWYHSHLGKPSLSAIDYRNHLAQWRAPWHVALVLGFSGREVVFYCWNDSRLMPAPMYYLY